MEAAAEDTPKEGSENVVSKDTARSRSPIPALVPLEVRRQRRDERVKKEEKNVEQFMKSLNSIPTMEEKLSLVCKKYVEAVDENKKLHFYIRQSDKRYALLVKEKEHLQLEMNKTVLVKSKLENLCRELQKQNKAVKEESLLKIREEEERRKETQAKFQNTLTEITSMLQQNNEKNAKLRDDNISMTEKFKSVVQQYQLREQQVDKMAKQMALEAQLSEAKLQKASLEHKADKERLLAEMETVKVTLAQYRAKIMELQGTETSLRSQLAVYTNKYDEFQNALVRSNQAFGGFKEQMDMMSKKILNLEKESLSWKTRWEKSQAALLEMCSERQANEERSASVTRQLNHMQGLCRTLQAERTVLLATLKEHDIPRPPLPTPPPAPAPPPVPATAPASNAKVDAMAANCAQLRQSLAHLQSQLNVLTNKQNNEQPKEQTPEKVGKKKSKSKKNKGDKKSDTPTVESDQSNTKESESEPNSPENTAENDSEAANDGTLENLIQAINNANINLCDLEVVNDEIVDLVDGNDKIEDSQVNEDITKEIKENIVAENTKEVNEVKSDVKVDQKASDTSLGQNKEIDNGDVSNDVKLDDVMEIIKNEVNDENITDNDSQNVSIVASVNDEISHINEVKPIINEAV